MVPKPHGVIGDNDLTVSVNGVIYQIQYDRTVYVPENVAEIIRSSIKLQNEKKEVIESFERSGRGSIADL